MRMGRTFHGAARSRCRLPTQKSGIPPIYTGCSGLYTAGRKEAKEAEEVAMEPLMFVLVYGLLRIAVPVVVLLTIGTLIQRRQRRAS
jgi:hypothetical protein